MKKQLQQLSAYQPGLSLKYMYPSLNGINRLIIFKVVVFPQPEGPIKIKNSPSLILKLTSSTATFVP